MVRFVIDNGTHTIKYNWSNLAPIIRQNTLYKMKNTFSFDSSKESYIKRAFIPGHNLIMNYDVLEGTIDSCFNECNVQNEDIDLIFTIGCSTPQVIKRDITELLMEVYRIQKLQLGIDSVYSYLYNSKNNRKKNALILSASHSETHAIRIRDKLSINELPYGHERARSYLSLLNNKRKESKIFEIKVPEYNYRKTCEEILKNLKKGKLVELKIQNEIESTKNKNGFTDKKMERENDDQTCESEEEIEKEEYEENIEENEEEYEQEETEINTIENQEEQSVSKEDLLDNQEDSLDNKKEAIERDETQEKDELENDEQKSAQDQEKRNKMIYFSSMYRFKIKIEKIIGEMKKGTENLENEYFKVTQPEKYLHNKKVVYQTLKLSVEKRQNLKRRLYDKKSRESVIYNRIYNFHESMETLTEDEVEIVNMIENLDELENDEIALNEILNEILEMDKFYTDHFSIFEVLDGCTLQKTDSNGVLENLSVFRAGEALFNPSVMGSTMPGLSEMIEDEMNQIQEIIKKEENQVDEHEKITYFIDEESNEIETINISEMNVLNVVRQKSSAKEEITVFVTGGFSQINGFSERIKNEVKMCAFQSMHVDFVKASDPVLDAFYGADFCEYFPVIDRQVYEEKGSYGVWK